MNLRLAATDDSSGDQLQQASMSIQPWQSFPATAVASSQQVANLTGSVTLTQIQEEVFDIMYAVPGHGVAYSLLQTSLDDEGKRACTHSLLIVHVCFWYPVMFV